MKERAVIDRIEDDQLAVLLVGDPERECVVSVERLPAGATAGTWLLVHIEDGQLLAARIDADLTRQADARIRSKLDLLRQRGRNLRPD